MTELAKNQSEVKIFFHRLIDISVDHPKPAIVVFIWLVWSNLYAIEHITEFEHWLQIIPFYGKLIHLFH